MFIKDRVALNSTRRFTDQGFMRVQAVLSRTGIQQYRAHELGLKDRDPLAWVNVYRPSEEVLNKDSVDTFSNIPVTDNHPPEPLHAGNTKEYQVGYSTKAEIKNDTLQAELIITDSETIKKIESGKKEISNGYSSEIEFKSGISPEGIGYEAIQTKIIGNHIAIVDSGRCGSRCKIADKSDKGVGMKVKIKGLVFDVQDENLAKAIEDISEENADLTEDLEKVITEKKAVQDSLDAVKDSHAKEVKSLQDAVPTAADIDALIVKRTEVINSAKTLVKDFDPTDKTCEVIRKEVVLTVLGDKAQKEADTAYYDASFDVLVAMKATKDKDSSSQRMTDAVSTAFKDNQDDKDKPKTFEQLRAEKIAKNRKFWDSRKR